MGFLEDNGIKAVCFDIDGTLYPKYQTNLYLLKAAVAHPVFSYRYNKMRGEIRRMDGLEGVKRTSLSCFRKRENSLMFSPPLPGYDEKYKKYMYEPWCRYDRSIRPFKGMKELLSELRDKGYAVGLLSDFPIGNKPQVLGIEGLYRYAASTEEVGTLKPNATPFLVMAEELGLSPGEILYVGDSYRKDVTGAAHAGCRTCLITGKKGDYPLADMVVRDYDGMKRMFFQEQ
ncbi:MAG: HAD family hydrolase [Bullifex sp.]|nr:HAD family hydrolase [Bullifex sp.]